MNEMTERIKAHLDGLMQGAPRTRRIEEMHQELLAGCLDKYEDLTAGGMDPESAYNEVVGGIGDVGELLGYIEKAASFNPADAEEKRRRRAFFTSAGICCYFIAFALAIVFGYTGHSPVGFAVFVVLAGIATMLIVFGRMTTVNYYERADDTLVEGMKEQMTRGRREGRLMGLISSTLWPLVVVLYLALSFVTGRWDVTWIIFIVAGAVQCGIGAMIYPNARVKHLTGAYWCFIPALYLSLSFVTRAWSVTWIIFPLAVAVHQAARLFVFWRSGNE